MRAARYILCVAAVVGGWGVAWAVDGSVSETGSRLVAAVPAPEPAPAAVHAPVNVNVPETDPELLGTFRMTRYYVVEEKSFKPLPRPDDEAVLASAAPRTTGVTLYDDRGCKPLATVTARFAEVLDVQGTGKLRDGRVLNVSSACRCGHSPCYRPTGKSARWGLSALSRPLEPFRSVAVDPDVVPLGSLLYIPELDGLTMPGRPPWGGFIHDGCVHAVDVGGGIDGQHIDFFVGRYQSKKALDARRKMKHVTVHRGDARCERSGSGVARKAGI